MMDLEIREAQIADVIQIAECLAEAFAPFRHLYTTGAFADTVAAADAIRDRIECMTVYVAVAPAGLVVGTLAAACYGQEGHLRGMAVRPEWQGQGIARRLLMAAKHHLPGARAGKLRAAGQGAAGICGSDEAAVGLGRCGAERALRMRDSPAAGFS